MAHRELRLIGDPILSIRCEEILEITPQVRQLVDDLLENVDDPGRTGLAANQIGVSLRAFSWHIGQTVDCILNPVIVELSEQRQWVAEGCLSVPGYRFAAPRAYYARAEGIDVFGNPKVVEGEGRLARCIQHEVGHLDGQLYLNSLEGKERAAALAAFAFWHLSHRCGTVIVSRGTEWQGESYSPAGDRNEH